MKIRAAFCLLLLTALVLVACSPASEGASQQVPTRALLPSNYRLEDAERVARDYLAAWGQDDRDTMYRWISLTSREEFPRDSFNALYENAAATMGLDRVELHPITISRQQDAIALFAYDAVFNTRLVGTFTDPGRTLTLVVDQDANEWRVAWSPDDLFAGMTNGSSLRFTSTIPNRANIYDRNGIVLADQSARAVKVQIVRRDVPDYESCLTALSFALDRPLEDVRTIIEIRPADWLLDMGVIMPEAYNSYNTQLVAACNARFVTQPARRYADGTLAPHILGYVGFPDEAQVAGLRAAGFSSEAIIGRSGIESAWDTTLRGSPGGRLVLVAPSGAEQRELANITAQPGQSLWLTLDADLQRYVVDVLAENFRLASASWATTSGGASAVVMNPNTGEILAVASYPTIDNNAYLPYPEMGRTQAIEMLSDFRTNPMHPEVNRPIQGLFPLGSVMKTVSAAAVADSGVYALNQRYTCTGIWSRDINRYDHVANGHGTLTLASSLTQSCNPYYYEVGYQIDLANPGLLPQYAKQLGFGSPTGIVDVAESAGFVPDPEWYRTSLGEQWRFSESVNLSIGQGYLQVTPLQVVRWFAAIANGGSLPRPSLVHETGLIGEAHTVVNTPEMTPTNLQPEVLETIQSGLCAVTQPGGTADFVFRNSSLQGFGVCGKTGTAQTGGPGTPPHAWFASYAPRENPEIVVVVMVETAGQGSEIAAPIARQIMEYYFGLQ